MEHAQGRSGHQGTSDRGSKRALSEGGRLAPGGRRHTPAFLAAQQRALAFTGLPSGITIKAVAASARRAAPLLGVNRSHLALIDLLTDHAQPHDFIDGSGGIVWCSNAWLAARGNWSEDYVQKMLRQLIERGLLGAVDSPNGKRYGARDAQGRIVFAYGIDLRPLAARHEELKALAAEVRRQHEERAGLARRLTIAARAICQLAETAIEHAAAGADWFAEAETASLARRHCARIRQADRLGVVVTQVEGRLEALKALLVPQLAEQPPCLAPSGAVESPPRHVRQAGHRTTTEGNSIKRTRCDASGERGGSGGAGAKTEGACCEERILDDLDAHKVTEAFVAKACPDACADLIGDPTWPILHERARNEGRMLGVTPQCWTEAQRVMGPVGAAAAMLLVVQKRRMGLIETPGAYFRALTKRAATGALELGRSFHGLRDAARKGSDAPPAGNGMITAVDRIVGNLGRRLRYDG